MAHVHGSLSLSKRPLNKRTSGEHHCFDMSHSGLRNPCSHAPLPSTALHLKCFRSLALNVNVPQMLAAIKCRLMRSMWRVFFVCVCLFFPPLLLWRSRQTPDQLIAPLADGWFLRPLLGCMKSSVCRGVCFFAANLRFCASVFDCVCLGVCVCVCLRRGNGCWEEGCCSCCLQTHNSLSGMLQSRLHLWQLKSVFSHKQQSKTHKN